MGKIAFVFAGQGAQYTGMGLDLYKAVPSAAKVYEAAEKIRTGTSEQCFYAGDEVLNQTENTQPCLFVTELACAAALSSKGIIADMTAGFSLGELAALAYAGASDFDSMFRLVCKRGELMQKAAEEAPASMVAVLKLSPEAVENICRDFSAVYPVNYNCPGQVSVSGLAEEMDAFCSAVKSAGGRAVPLKVSGGFHSPFMKSASAALGKILEDYKFRTPEITVYSNCTGCVYSDDISGLLSKQVSSPVRWEMIVRNMISAGADTFIELGPGETLCGMIKRIDRNVKTLNVSDVGSFEKTLSEVTA